MIVTFITAGKLSAFFPQMHRVSSLWNCHVKILNLLLQSIGLPDHVYSYLALSL